MSRFIFILFLLLGAWVYFRVKRQPSSYEITRSRRMDASPSQLKALLADFSLDEEWNAFLHGDVGARYQLSEKPCGVGAKMTWQGKRAGTGESEITEVSPHHVMREIRMKSPIQTTNHVLFTFDVDGDKTLLTWKMSGQSKGFQKVLSSMVNSDAMIEASFERGFDKIEDYFKRAKS